MGCAYHTQGMLPASILSLALLVLAEHLTMLFPNPLLLLKETGLGMNTFLLLPAWIIYVAWYIQPFTTSFEKIKHHVGCPPLTTHLSPECLGVMLHQTLTFKAQVEKMKGKISACNDILWKLVTSKWGAHPATL